MASFSDILFGNKTALWEHGNLTIKGVDVSFMYICAIIIVSLHMWQGDRIQTSELCQWLYRKESRGFLQERDTP